MSSTSSTVSFTGLASGLNMTSLIQNVLRFNQARITSLNTTVTNEQTQQKTLLDVQNSLQSLQIDSNQLAQTFNGVFSQTAVSSSNSNVVTAATGNGAQTGVTNLQVLQLAQANQIASQGFSSSSATITQGTFQISSGGQSANITIDSSNDTLSGLASSINNSGIGVTATVVNTGSPTASTPTYRLLLTSDSTGTANAIQISNGLAASGNGAILPDFSDTEIGSVNDSLGFSSTSSITSNSGTGTYTGNKNDTYTFTVANGGTVGTDDGITLNYTNSDGSKTGTITLNASDVNTPQDVVDGLQLNFAAGTLKAGDQFSVDAYVPVIQTAQNAQVQLGSGSGALVVQSASNTVSNLIPGVTLSLQSAAPGQTVQLNVTHDVAGAASAISKFVDDYNAFATALDTATAYSPASGTTASSSGPLNGITSLSSVRSQIEQQILATPANMSANLNQLSQLGITATSNGQLQINSQQVVNVLSGNVPGVSYTDVAKLFSLQGQSSTSAVEFATAGPQSKPSTAGAYTVHITQAATQASVTSTNPIGSSTDITDSNNTFQISMNGKSPVTVTLDDGTYSLQSLATEVQTQINNAISSSGNSVSVSVQNNNSLSITTAHYGSSASIAFGGGDALSALGFTGSETGTGTDVAGSFIVNGVTENATGAGQILSGNSTNANTAGLKIAVSYTPSEIPPGGVDSTLLVTSGVASSLNNSLSSLLNPTNGVFAQLNNQFTSQIKNAQNNITTQTAAMNAQQASLMQQFAALESVLASLQETSNLLTSELGASSTTAGPTLNQLTGNNSNSSNSSSSSSTTKSNA